MISLKILLFSIVLLFVFYNNVEGLPQPILDESKIEKNKNFQEFMDGNKYKSEPDKIDKIYDIIDNVQNNIDDLDDKINYYHNKYCENDKCFTCKLPIPPPNSEIDTENCGIDGLIPLNSKCKFKCKSGFIETNNTIGYCSKKKKISSSSPNYENEIFYGENRAIFDPLPNINCIQR